MKTVEEARSRWNRFFALSPSSTTLKRALLSNEPGKSPCENGLRSVCWKAFLLDVSLDSQDPVTSWRQRLSASREAYAAVRAHHLRYIEHPDNLSSTADPLTGDDDSPWQALRQDEALREEIYQDVERCMQDNYFFRDPKTKARMLDILFVYAKLNPDLGYRQGMHELLAPILWVVEGEAIRDGEESQEQVDQDSLLFETLDCRHVESDSFTLFSAVMSNAKALYEHGDGINGRPADPSYVSPIVARSRRIHQVLLNRVDPELAVYLERAEILPQIFLTRWLRLLFGREFPFEDVLSLWDMLFAENMRLELIDNVCVAMLLRIRWQLLESDYSGALALLLKYPSPSPYHPRTFVNDALLLEKEPSIHTGSSIILKYSTKMPSFAGSDSPELQRMGLGKGGDAGTSPGLAVNGGRLNRKLDSLFHDVSGGVAKAVKGAVGEARRNFNAAGQHGSVGGTVSQFRRSGNSIASGLSPSNPNAFAMSELNKKVFALENRSKALGAMLSGVLSEFKAAQRKQQEEAEKKEKGGEKGEKEGAGTEAKPDAMTQATDLLLAKVQFVQVYLEDPTIPIGDADTLGPDTGSPFTVAGSEWDKLSPRSNSVAIDSPNDPFVLAAESPENLARRSPGIGLSKETSRTSEPRNVSNLDGSTDTKSPIKSPSPSTPAKDHRSRPSQTRPVSHTRAPLSESPFSWMLGESKDTRPGGFSPLHTPSRSVAGSTSASPAMASPSAERRRHGSLFGDVDDGDDGKDTMSKHARGSSLNKLGLE